ncbi:MAG: hypothetical protein J7576_11470 [Siphonobacter aquaeclarae]|nr:hypothetical protein [Siphonobacter aquaeclarae]
MNRPLKRDIGIPKETTPAPDQTPVISLPAERKSSLEAEKLEAQKMQAAAAARLEAIAATEQQEQEAARAAGIAAMNERLADAAYLKAQAREETDEREKRQLFLMAGKEEEKARTIAVELGLSQSAPGSETEKRPWWYFTPAKMALYQILGILSLLYFCYTSFTGYQARIAEMNKTLPFDKQLQPYDETSLQKFFFEKLVQFSDLPTALLMVFLVVPFVGFYVLPFFGYGRNIYTEFKEEISPWQRIKFTAFIVLGFLFYLALSHLVKP